MTPYQLWWPPFQFPICWASVSASKVKSVVSWESLIFAFNDFSLNIKCNFSKWLSIRSSMTLFVKFQGLWEDNWFLNQQNEATLSGVWAFQRPCTFCLFKVEKAGNWEKQSLKSFQSICFIFKISYCNDFPAFYTDKHWNVH